MDALREAEQPSPGPVSPPEQPPFFQRISPVAFAAISLCIIFFLYQVVAGAATVLLSHGKITNDNVLLIRWATLIGQLLFILLPTLVLVKLRHKRLADFFLITWPEYREVILTFVAVFALQQVLQGYTKLQEALPLPPAMRDIIDQFKDLLEETYATLTSAHSPAEFVFVVIVVALVPAISEELLFRGLVQRSFEQVTPGIRGAVIAGLIFGAYHLNPFSLVPVAALGIYFGFVVYRTRNIIVAVSAHFFNNFLACTAVYMKVDDDVVVLAPSGVVTPSLVFLNYMFFAVVFVLATYYFIRVTEHIEETER